MSDFIWHRGQIEIFRFHGANIWEKDHARHSKGTRSLSFPIAFSTNLTNVTFSIRLQTLRRENAQKEATPCVLEKTKCVLSANPENHVRHAREHERRLHQRVVNRSVQDYVSSRGLADAGTRRRDFKQWLVVNSCAAVLRRMG